jgi:CRISPR-associated protein Csb2
MLVLEMELLTGVYRASLPDGSGSEWPPHPERLYSALVQAWGAGGRVDDERAALEWLEAQPPPEIDADVQVGHRDPADVFVPPNDMSAMKLEALPIARPKQPRRFDCVAPQTPLVRYRWPQSEPSPSLLHALDALSSRTVRVGHSSSLVRLFVRRTHLDAPQLSVWRPAENGNRRIRVPHPGRLEALERWFHSDRPQRPRVGVTAFYEAVESSDETTSSILCSTFASENDWFVFAEDERSRFRPDILGFSYVALRVRDALMSLCEQQPAPEVLSGHGPGGKPSRSGHIAVLPLANVGFEHSDGTLLGFAIVLPRQLRAADRRTAIRAIASFAGIGRADVAAKLHLRRTATWILKRSPNPLLQSLRPARYCAETTVWASATPVLLDRHLDRSDPLEEAELIAKSCEHIGLPSPIEIEVHKHSAIRGATSAYLSSRHGPNWSFRSGALANRPRRHVVLRFNTPVRGPVVVGAGRYQGFGLCLPLAEGALWQKH